MTPQEQQQVQQLIAAHQAYIQELRLKVRHLRRTLEVVQDEDFSDFDGFDVMQADPAQLRRHAEAATGAITASDEDLIPQQRGSRTIKVPAPTEIDWSKLSRN